MPPTRKNTRSASSKGEEVLVRSVDTHGRGGHGLPSPLADLGSSLSDSDLRETAYELLLGVCRSSAGKALTFISQSLPSSEKSLSVSPSFLTNKSPLTSSAASKMKKALGLKSLSKKSGSGSSSSSSSSPSGSRPKQPTTMGELLRLQMRVSEQTDSRIRRALLRIASSQQGRSMETFVLPLELLQQLKASDFPDSKDYIAWQSRNLKVLEVGLLLHPSIPLDKNNLGAQRLQQILHGGSDKPIETGRNSESMQVLRTTVMSLACRSIDDSGFETCRWADGYPLNLQLYLMLLEACFDISEETVFIEEIDEILEVIKKTWPILGMNQMLHNLCFSWILFSRFVSTGQVENDLLIAADSQLLEVAKDSQAAKDPIYAKILSSFINSIMNWAEKRLLAYYDTFHGDNLLMMQTVVSLGVSAAKLLVEDISYEYRRRRKEEVDIARERVETYIRSSLRTAFAQKMEEADAVRRQTKSHQYPVSRLSILAKATVELANVEKNTYSPILRRWHPFAAGIAVATLHTYYGNELKQFMSGLTELTPENVQVLKAADKLEKDLVMIAVEDSVDSDDGGKAIIREMPPYEAESSIANLARVWIKSRITTQKEWIDRNLHQEAWNPRQTGEKFALSSVETLRLMDETLSAFFELPIPMHQDLVPDLVTGLDKSLQHYIFKAKSSCGTRSTYLPVIPALTRCPIGSKFQGVFKKKDKQPNLQKRNSQVGSFGDNDIVGVSHLCVRLNTLLHIQTQLGTLEKKINNGLRDLESSQVDNVNEVANSFQLSYAACEEGIPQLCEAIAYKLIFHDLNPLMWDGLYIGDVASSRLEPFRSKLDSHLEFLFNNLAESLRNIVVETVMRASFEGFLMVLLAGGPSRAFTTGDSQNIEDDFASLKSLYVCGGDGLPEDLVEKAASTVKNVLPYFRLESERLIEMYRHFCIEVYGPAAKSKLPLPPTSGRWKPNEPNTLLRVMCYRHDEVASKFLKRAYNLPKKL